MINYCKLLLANSKELIIDEVNNLISSYNIDNENIKWIETNNLNVLYYDIFQIKIIEELSIKIINLDEFISNNKLNDNIIQIVDKLNSNPTSDLIYFYSLNNKISNKSTIFKEIINLESITETNKTKLIKNILKEKNINLNEDQLQLINKRLTTNVLLIRNELNKLNENNIKYLDQLINDYSNSFPFNIAEAFLLNDIVGLKNIINNYDNSIQTYMLFFNVIVNKITNLLILKHLLNNHNDNEYIKQKMNKSDYALKKEIKLLDNININILKKALNMFYNLEKDIRLNNLNPYNSLVLMLFKEINNE